MGMTDDQVTALLVHVKALLKTAQTKPADGEIEHVMVTDLFPGFVAAVEATLKLADEWAADSFIVDPEIALRNAIGRALAGEEAT